MARWELWESEGGYSFFPETNTSARSMIEDEGGYRLIWTFEADGWDAAHRARHEFLAWEEYRPMLRDDGTPYPEDERDPLPVRTDTDPR
jgi:hypothetical protein